MFSKNADDAENTIKANQRIAENVENGINIIIILQVSYLEGK